MKYATPLILLPLLLAACETAPSSALEQADRLAVPDVKQYTKEQQAQAAAEMDRHCVYVPMLCQFVIDYSIMRDQARVASASE